MYGLTKADKEFTKIKVAKQLTFAQNNGFTMHGQYHTFASMIKSPIFNTHRYIAEIQNRVHSINRHAVINELSPMFITLTLPSSWHKQKTITTKKGKKRLVDNPNYEESHVDEKTGEVIEHTVKNGCIQLTKMFQKFRESHVYKNTIPSSKRSYFRVTEPHKNGTPHVHILLYVPEDKKEKLEKTFKRYFPSPLGEIELNVKDASAYLMKYVLKTIDDFRGRDPMSLDHLTELSYWYTLHGVTRFYTSRTLISLDVYRVLNGRYTMMELTTMYENQEIRVWVDEKGKVMDIYENGLPVYKRSYIELNKESEELKEYKNEQSLQEWKAMMLKVFDNRTGLSDKCIPVEIEGDDLYIKHWLDEDLVKHTQYHVISDMSDLALFSHYNDIKENHQTYEENYDFQHYQLTHNAMIDRELLDEEKFRIENVDDYVKNYFEGVENV
jgi:hypothetical protein